MGTSFPLEMFLATLPESKTTAKKKREKKGSRRRQLEGDKNVRERAR